MICLKTMKPNLLTPSSQNALAFNYIPTPGSFSLNFELSTIASEEGSGESVHMWNLDRAFSPDGRR